jgi:hypothetical protein
MGCDAFPALSMVNLAERAVASQVAKFPDPIPAPLLPEAIEYSPGRRYPCFSTTRSHRCLCLPLPFGLPSRPHVHFQFMGIASETSALAPIAVALVRLPVDTLVKYPVGARQRG